MTKFETLFPSLKKYKFIDPKTDDFGFIERDIRKCCLDKKIVLQAIDKIESEYTFGGDSGVTISGICIGLRKYLHLKREKNKRK